MKRILIAAIALLLTSSLAFAQSTGGKEAKKNLTIKEWKKSADGKSVRFLDHVTKYNAQGRKVEEIEYASYGQKKRIVYEYEGSDTKCTRQVEYDDKNHVSRIKKFEYNDDGTRKVQYNYKPNGKLESTKNFEYSYK